MNQRAAIPFSGATSSRFLAMVVLLSVLATTATAASSRKNANSRTKSKSESKIIYGGTSPGTRNLHQGEPRMVKLVHGTEDLVPIISYDVTAAPYSADKAGKKDATAAFAAALADAEVKGGTVFAPSGRYRIDGTLVIPPGVTLRGDWKKPTNTDARVKGTVLLAYSGRGNVNAEAFLSVEMGGVRDLSVFYPEQKATDVTPYPTTVHLTDSAVVKNVTLVNAYRGVLTGGFSTVINLYGTALDSGLTMLYAASVPRCRNIQLSPRFWSESGMSNSPNESQLRKVLLDRKAFAIQLNRQDAGIFIDVQIDGYHTGLKFMPPHGWTFWHNLKIINSEIGAHFTGGLEHRMHATNCSISAKHCGVLMQMDEERWEPEWQKHLHSNRKGKEYGTKRDNGHLRMFNCSFEGSGTGIYLDGSFDQKINLQECTFKNWGTGPDDYAIKAIGGEIEVYDSHFKQGSRHIELQGRPKLLELVGNRFSGTPAIKAPNVKGSIIDHTPARDTGRSMRPIHAVPDMLPARTGGDSLFVVTAPPYNTPTDGKGDATTGIQAALKKAYKAGGGTVYLPQGRYRLTKPLKVPPGVELRGVNDFMPRSIQLRTLIIADIPADCGNPNNPPLISLYSSKKIGGSGIAGVSFWYPNQNYKDIQAYPWTIQGRGPGCWVQRVYLGNCYNAVDFATHDSDRHVLSRVCGSALNTAFFVGRSSTIGWIDNCHIRPQDWSLIMDERGKVTKNNRKGNNKTKRRKGYVFEIPGGPDSKPTKKDIFRGTPYSLIPNMRGAGAVVVGSGANEQITAFFTNGATRAFDFVDHTGRGGGNANILIGGSEAGWGAWIKKLGKKGITMVNFSFSAMTRFPYITPKDIPAGQLPKGLVIKIEPTVATTAPITMISPKFYGRGDIPLGVDMQGGDLSLKQGMTVIGFTKAVVDVKKGRFRQRNTKMGDVIGGSK